MTTNSTAQHTLKYADIGINLTDLQYDGIYHGKKHHEGKLFDQTI